MQKFFVELLGLKALGEGEISAWSVRLENTHNSFQALLFVLVAAFCVFAVWWFYKKEPAICSTQRKRAMAFLRISALWLLLLIFAEPVIDAVKYEQRLEKFVLLVDVSQSMQLEVRNREVQATDQGPLSRIESVRNTLGEDRSPEWLLKLQENYRLELWTFEGSGNLQCSVPAERFGDMRYRQSAIRQLSASGETTALGNALLDLRHKLRGERLAGVMLFTDGANNEGIDPLAAVRELKLPLYPIGFGAPEVSDAAIAQLFVESKLFIDDPAPCYVRLWQSGFDGSAAELVVSLDGEEVLRHSFTFTDREQAERLRFQPKKAGSGTLRLELLPLAGESDKTNNIIEQAVEAIDKRIKVLVVEGAPRWEYRYLRNSLTADKRVEPSFLLRSPDLPLLAEEDPAMLKRFPDRQALFRYDVLILGDVPNDTFWSMADLENIRQFVTLEGGGLWMIAGKSALPHQYRDTPLEELVPVQIEQPMQPSVREERQRPAERGFRLAVTPSGRTHSIVQLQQIEGSGTDRSGLWEYLPPIYWNARTTRVKPGAVPLLVKIDDRGMAPRTFPSPLLVTAQVGAGRVLYSAFQDLWRMRQVPELGEETLRAFHGHVMQYLGLAHATGSSSRLRLSLSTKNALLGQSVDIFVRVLDRAAFTPQFTEKMEALVTDLKDGSIVEKLNVYAVLGRPGFFETSWLPRATGQFRILIVDEETQQSVYEECQIRRSATEKDSVALRKDLLDSMARASQQDDPEAKMLRPQDLVGLAEKLRGRQKREEFRFEEPLWDAPLIWLLLLLLLCSEWFLRKRSNLC